MGFIRGLIGFPFAVFLAVFAVLNRHDVTVNVGPFYPELQLPLYLVAVGLMAVGFVFGGAFVWFNEAGVRRMRRKQRRQIKDLECEVDALKNHPDIGAEPVSEFFPSLTKALPAKGKSST